jgi:TusA-related sulfurtransferase
VQLPPTPAIVDLSRLGLDRGGHLLLARALASIDVGAVLEVRGADPSLAVHLRGWCRANGHRVIWPEANEPWLARVVRGGAQVGRWSDARRAGAPDPRAPGAVVDRPSPTWGLAGRGARVESGAPAFSFPIADKDVVWAEEAASLYAQAAASQWDPATAIDWNAAFELPEEIEDAVVQIMTYLIENETAALVIPARFAAQIHPHFREVVQLLAIQAADEARHIEVFTRRALLRRPHLGLSTAGGQASLKTLIDEPDFALASFLLSVLGEGSFLSLLWFIHEHAPDPVTRQVARLAAQDEARHVAFGLAHLSRHLEHDAGLHDRLAMAVERRHDALQDTAGLNGEVFDALVLLAAGAWTPEALETGWDAVVALQQDMDEGRRKRLRRLGFAPEEAAHLSSLHTRNFM